MHVYIPGSNKHIEHIYVLSIRSIFAVYLCICMASIIGSSTASEIKQKHSLDDAQSESDAQIENIIFFILVIIIDTKYKKNILKIY